MINEYSSQVNYDGPKKSRELAVKLRKITAIGSATLIGAIGIGKAAWEVKDQSGEHTVYPPKQLGQVAVNNRLGLLSWNMHNETRWRIGEIEEIATQQELDVIALQEVNAKDAKRLQISTEGWYVTYAMADAKTNFQSGGFGNVIMTRQRPKDIQTRPIDGTSYIQSVLGTVEGLFVDVANAETSLENAADGSQEDRVALAMTINSRDGDKDIETRFITAHIASNREVGYIYGHQKIHKSQMSELKDFIKDNLRKGRPTFVCGDLNAPPEEVIPWFRSMDFTVVRTDPTFAGGRQTLDYCAYNPGAEGLLTLENGRVMKNHITDHHPMIVNFSLDDQEKIALKYRRPTTPKQERQNQLSLHYQTHQSIQANASMPVRRVDR